MCGTLFMWFGAAMTSQLAVAESIRSRRRRKKRRLRCNYQLGDAAICPECGNRS
jgi:hypothetical protein